MSSNYLPGSVKVGHSTYAIVEDDEVRDNGAGAMIYLMRERICVAPSLAPGYVRTSVWHELIHAMIHRLGYNQNEDEENERFVDGLAHQLVDLICDNQDLLIWTYNITPEQQQAATKTIVPTGPIIRDVIDYPANAVTDDLRPNTNGRAINEAV